MTSIDSPITSVNRLQAPQNAAKMRDPLPRLLLQLTARAGNPVIVERATSRPWASALFQGRRHVIALQISGVDAAERRRRFADGIEDAEWALGSHFVADITIDDHHASAEGEWIELSALTIEDW
ncbi:hypothetical protein [Sphingobium bisphenolivorans]|uniref:hypothetical protein n=1 Tax=Sphingobium bisphenolivorans TaxID=1335760 RepID=UPI0003A2D2A9|nr:hypothetical protein [Sphingobium bisphenolivorans]